jgi:UDP-2-acetamido-2,6-beta-L-arabino-hexul-4-ose reductase
MRILVTGSQGFVGKNLLSRLRSLKDFEVITFNRGDDDLLLEGAIKKADHIIHLAGENRPKQEREFLNGNIALTKKICNLLNKHDLKTPILFTSSKKAGDESLYGKSKLAAEDLIRLHVKKLNSPAIIYRLPGVFGKWCKPNYNSVVATFCHNIAQNIPINIHDTKTTLNLVYIDDVISDILRSIISPPTDLEYRSINPEYGISLGELAEKIYMFNKSRNNLEIKTIGSGLNHALYSTFISYLPKEKFTYSIPYYQDDRGTFIEMLKTEGCGQVSLFTANPGISRGKHYHDTKTEKFLVVKGSAKFRFENIQNKEYYEVDVCSSRPTIVQTIPGWAHEIINTGSDELIAIIWANEIFDQFHPDTYEYEINS